MAVIRRIIVTINDFSWPDLECVVDARGKTHSRTSLYDTANSNFEPMLTNELMFVVRDMIRERKEHPHGVSEPIQPPKGKAKVGRK